ncbi:hypothetical protein BBAD15_g12096 [Beauveria bassiana D1-5]|uniref:Uncharacterized protein n=1 Tax=Beauveria bassiana D1-5 TaxID=1245745 RepID=A0A0A2VPG8_BEABA|nr:hypothetical protein BBAD15_g12096 [Beauveria bassiana D1-5]
MGLRQNIDFLEVCRERLEADIKAATEEKDVLSQALLAEKQIVNSMRGGSRDIDEPTTERRQPLENVPLTPGEGRAVEDGAAGLEYMIRSAFDSEEEHLAPTEDIPLPLFSRALPAVSDRPLEAPMGNQTEETIEARSAVPEDGEKVRVAFKILEQGEWIVDREVVVDTEDPSEVQRLAIKYLRRDMGLFSSKNRVLAAEACFDRSKELWSRRQCAQPRLISAIIFLATMAMADTFTSGDIPILAAGGHGSPSIRPFGQRTGNIFPQQLSYLSWIVPRALTLDRS